MTFAEQLKAELDRLNVTLSERKNKTFTITRWPNAAGLKRGPNMMAHLCHCCLESKTHGFRFVQFHDEKIGVQHMNYFVCDECLNASKKTKN